MWCHHIIILFMSYSHIAAVPIRNAIGKLMSICGSFTIQYKHKWCLIELHYPIGEGVSALNHIAQFVVAPKSKIRMMNASKKRGVPAQPLFELTPEGQNALLAACQGKYASRVQSNIRMTSLSNIEQDENMVRHLLPKGVNLARMASRPLHFASFCTFMIYAVTNP